MTKQNFHLGALSEGDLLDLIRAARVRLADLRRRTGNRNFTASDWLRLAGQTFTRKVARSTPERNGTYQLKVLQHMGQLGLRLIQPNGPDIYYGWTDGVFSPDSIRVNTPSGLLRESRLQSRESLATFFRVKGKRKKGASAEADPAFIDRFSRIEVLSKQERDELSKRREAGNDSWIIDNLRRA